MLQHRPDFLQRTQDIYKNRLCILDKIIASSATHIFNCDFKAILAGYHNYIRRHIDCTDPFQDIYSGQVTFFSKMIIEDDGPVVLRRIRFYKLFSAAE